MRARRKELADEKTIAERDLDDLIEYTLEQLDGEEKTMALKEIPATKEGEQLLFQSIELGEVVRELQRQEFEKKEIDEDYTGRIKALKKRMYKLAAEMKAGS